MTDKEVMQMALDVLANNRYAPSIKETTEALRAALAQPEPKNDEYCPACDGDYCIAKAGCVALIKPPQPEPEPVGRFAKFSDGIWKEVTDGSAGQPLYAAPQKKEWVGLTDDEYELMAEKRVTSYFFNTLDYAHAIEAKLKEKNT